MNLETEILKEVKKYGQGVHFKTLANKLKKFDEKDKATLRRYLNNLESARKITYNHKKDIICIATIKDFIYKGIITIDKRTGDGYLKSNGKVFIIRHDYLKGALNGDTILIKSSNTEVDGKIIAFVDKIVERKEITIAGVYKNGKVTTLSSQQELKLNYKETKILKKTQ